jgi:CRP-like cAMP-binding protein
MAAVWFVESGLLRSHFLDAQGRERNCAFHPEGQWAGLPPPRGAPLPAPVAIEALAPSRVVALSHAALANLLHAQPQWQATLTDALVANLMAQSRREASLTMHSAEERYALFLAEQPALAGRVALHHVASYLGITNVALSRIRRRMKQRLASTGATAGASTSADTCHQT